MTEASSAEPIVEIRNLSKAYRRGGQIVPQWAIAAFCIVVIIALVLGGLAAVW